MITALTASFVLMSLDIVIRQEKIYTWNDKGV